MEEEYQQTIKIGSAVTEEIFCNCGQMMDIGCKGWEKLSSLLGQVSYKSLIKLNLDYSDFHGCAKGRKNITNFNIWMCFDTSDQVSYQFEKPWFWGPNKALTAHIDWLIVV